MAAVFPQASIIIPMDNNKYLLLQINDALFPIGGYSHSYGLETYIQKGKIKNEADAGKYIMNYLAFNLCHNDLLGVRLAYEYGTGEDTDSLAALSNLFDVTKAPAEIRNASIKLGSRFIKTVNNLDIKWKYDTYQTYLKKTAGANKHHALVYGLFCASADIAYKDMMEHFLYAQASGMVTNCVKTIPLSQNTGQRILFECHGIFQNVLDKVCMLTMEDFGLSVPGFDISSMQHENLYSRIYMS